MKNAVRRLLPDCLWQVIRRKAIQWFRKGYFGLNDLDRKLEKYVNYDDGFYVELGANDGVTQSNSLYFELKRRWRGVLVEPSPHKFLACAEVRGRRNAVFCNACVGFDYRERFVEIEYANLMSVSRGLDLDLDDVSGHIADARPFLKDGEGSFSFGAVARPLSHLLDESRAPEIIDFLSLDVEGAELEVLRGVDFGKYRFKYILVECRDIQRLEAFLQPHGYAICDKLSEHDYLFSS